MKYAPVALVIGAAFLLWPTAPNLVTWILLLVLLALALNKWDTIVGYFQ